MRTALIDADSLCYVIGWNYRQYVGTTDPEVFKEVYRSCDNFLGDILILTQSKDYIGAFSDVTNFRYRIYQYARYKGTRPPKDEWIQFWEPIIRAHYSTERGFITMEDLEADDVICALDDTLTGAGEETVICSPDKDLRQIPGSHYDYREQARVDVEVNLKNYGVVSVTALEAEWNFWMQVLSGDSTDNIAGIPGMGPVKAKAFLLENEERITWPSIVEARFQKYFGPHYGKLIFQETVDSIMLMNPVHRYWKDYHHHFKTWKTHTFAKDLSNGLFDSVS